MTFGEKLIKLRKQMGLSQEELASQITVSRQSISKWELNESIPDTENMVQISDIFNVSIDYLLKEEVDSEEQTPVVQKAVTKTQKKTYRKAIIILAIIAALVAVGYSLNLFAYTTTIVILICVGFILYLIIKALLIYIRNAERK